MKRMKIVRYPKREAWREILRRPSGDSKHIDETVWKILEAVKQDGDKALRDLTRTLDGVELEELTVSGDEFTQAETRVPEALQNAIQTAKTNIEKFHMAQIEEVRKVETAPGVLCWRKSVPIEKIGLYAPAGTAPLFSSVLMLGIPALLAGCREVILCSPPDKKGKVADSILYAASVCGITRVFKVGGAQAIAALTYGTKTIPKVYKIFGPGNRFVTIAKQMVATDVAIDIPAGPSEVAVLADDSCNPAFVAADLLSQAEHGSDSQILLVTTSKQVIDETLCAIEKQLTDLPRREIAKRSLANSRAVLVGDLEVAVDLINEYAAEHLILATRNADIVAEKIINAGSVFIGNYSCESAGDYASGTNHTLPTGGFARCSGGVSLDSFVKKITFQKLTADGIRTLAPTIECMAAAEGLEGHRRAVSVRLGQTK